MTYHSPDIFSEGATLPGSQQYGCAYEELMFSINANVHVDRGLARAALLDVLRSDARDRDVRLGSLLVGSYAIATPGLVSGFIDAVSEFESLDVEAKLPSLPPEDTQRITVGCAGSGKKGVKTINITTPAMIIAASAGAYSLKAGSHSTSSLTGSTDIMEAVGFKVPYSTPIANKILESTGFGFYSIEQAVPKFNEVYGGKFFAPHTLSLALPAMLIPVQVEKLFYGYSGPNVLLSASSLLQLGHKNVLACSNTTDGVHYIDEIAMRGVTTIAGARNGIMGNSLRFDAEQFFNVSHQTEPSIFAKSNVADHAATFTGVVDGRYPNSFAENTICANAATILYLAEIASDPREGFGMAVDSVRNGAASRKLQEVVEASNDYDN